MALVDDLILLREEIINVSREARELIPLIKTLKEFSYSETHEINKRLEKVSGEEYKELF